MHSHTLYNRIRFTSNFWREVYNWQSGRQLDLLVKCIIVRHSNFVSHMQPIIRKNCVFNIARKSKRHAKPETNNLLERISAFFRRRNRVAHDQRLAGMPQRPTMNYLLRHVLKTIKLASATRFLRLKKNAVENQIEAVYNRPLHTSSYDPAIRRLRLIIVSSPIVSSCRLVSVIMDSS